MEMEMRKEGCGQDPWVRGGKGVSHRGLLDGGGNPPDPLEWSSSEPDLGAAAKPMMVLVNFGSGSVFLTRLV